MNSLTIRCLTVSFVLLACLGCQQRAANKLLGRWIGRPDTAATRARREAEKYGDEQPVTSSKADDGQDAANDTVPTTDWEKYEVTVVMDFVSLNRIEMTLDGKQPVSGTWQTLSTSPSGCTIEIQTEAAESGKDASQDVRRRFELLFDEREGECVGFQLSESGADAQLGSLYFARPGNSDAATKN